MRENHAPAQTAVVTGASQGIGRAVALCLVARGYRVFGLSRQPGKEKEIFFIPCDVTRMDSVISAFDEVMRLAGRIDILICNAGMGISGAVEFIGEDEYSSQFQVNVFGAVRCAQAVLSQMRRQQGGKILFVSSLASLFPIAFQSFYSMSKAALDSFAGALGCEAAPFGISTGVLLLGDVKTEFTEHRKKNEGGDEAYKGRIRLSVAKMEADERRGMPPEQVAAAVCRVLHRKRLPPRTIVGISNKALALLGRLLPYRLVLFLLKRRYG